MKSNKILVILGVIFFIFISAFNVYMFTQKDIIENKKIETLKQDNESLLSDINKKDNEIRDIKSKNQKDFSESEEYKAILKAQRFIEMVYINDEESYLFRKKEAPKYMSDELKDRFFPSDNLISDNTKSNVSNIELYKKVINENDKIKVITAFNLEFSIIDNGYYEENKLYMILTLDKKEDEYIVTHIEEFNIKEGI